MVLKQRIKLFRSVVRRFFYVYTILYTPDKRLSMQASIRELRLHTKELFDAALRGEKVYVTCRNQDPIQLVPVKSKLIATESDAFGMWKDNENVTNVDEFIDKLRRSRHHVD